MYLLLDENKKQTSVYSFLSLNEARIEMRALFEEESADKGHVAYAINRKNAFYISRGNQQRNWHIFESKKRYALLILKEDERKIFNFDSYDDAVNRMRGMYKREVIRLKKDNPFSTVDSSIGKNFACTGAETLYVIDTLNLESPYNMINIA